MIRSRNSFPSKELFVADLQSRPRSQRAMTALKTCLDAVSRWGLNFTLGLPRAASLCRSSLCCLLGSTLCLLTSCVRKEHEQSLLTSVTSPARYLPPLSCQPCHSEIYSTYQNVAMARSFYRPSADNVTEDYETQNHFYHAPSKRHYRMIRRGDGFFQQRYQLDVEGREANLLEQEVTFIIGSGNHSRSYLNLSRGGVLTELPVSWYPQRKRWGMSPGYDKPRHHDFSRKIDYGCLFCHNAYPKLPEGADRYGHENLFPQDLPSGIDCQRCHGPGSQHVEFASAGADVGAVKRAIVNPARLSSEHQMDICQQCHLETTSDELPQAVRVFGRPVYSFRPGEALSDYLIHFDHAPGTGHDDKFEINSSAYRLRKSACFQKSHGQLICTTCHNPHSTVRGEEAVRHFRESCMKCHGQLSAGMHPTPRSSDCASCHMPRRRTEDVVQVAMTDHWIQRRPPNRNLLAPLNEDHTPYHGEVVSYASNPAGSASATHRELYWAIAQVRDKSNLSAGLAKLNALVAQQQPALPEPWMELALAQMETGDLETARHGLRRALELDPGLLLARYNLGRACQLLGQVGEAIAHYQAVLQLDPDHSEAHNNLGLLLQSQGQPDAASQHFQKALARSPLFVDAHNNLGSALAEERRWEEAMLRLRKALQIEPASADAHNNLGKVYGARGELAEATACFRHAVSADPSHWVAHFNLGRALEAAGRKSEARAAYREGRRLKPDLEVPLK